VLDTLGMVHQGMATETAALVPTALAAIKTRLRRPYRHPRSRWEMGRYCAGLGRSDDAQGFFALI